MSDIFKDLDAANERENALALEQARKGIDSQPIEPSEYSTDGAPTGPPMMAPKAKETSTFWPKDTRAPEDIPAYEGELGRAVVGGAIDLYNSVGSIPKFFDKDFYKPQDPSNPYEYKAPWLIDHNPIMKTGWGRFIRSGTEMVAGLLGTGKVMWGMKGLKAVHAAHKGTVLGRAGLSAVQGGVYDVISNQSQEANLARTLIDLNPRMAGIFDPIATREDMSAAQTAFMNVGEGLGIGAFFDLALEAGGWGLRSWSTSAKKGAKKATLQENPLTKAIDDSSDVDYAVKTKIIEDGAKAAYERSLYRQLKNKGKVQVGIKEWRKTNPWKKLDSDQQGKLMEIFADKQEIDWGPTRDVSRRGTKQAKANEDLALQQLEFDMSAGKPRSNPAYYKGGDISDNQALSSSSKPVKGVRDMIEIRNDPQQKYGSPRGTLTEANIRRLEYNAPGTVTVERNILAKNLVASPAYQKLYGEAMPDAIAKDLANASNDLVRFLNDSGHSRLVDVPEADLIKYIKAKEAGRLTVIEGVGSLNKAQLVATDTILGQLLYEARDLAKAALSVQDKIDVAADGGLLDGIMARYSGIARMRKETSMLSSFELRKWNAGGKLKDTIDEATIRGKASDAAAQEIATFKQLLKGDLDNDLLESFIHFTATGNGNKQMWKDFQAFFKRKLKGYRGKDGYQRNAILNEMATMGVNAMLSGPKTASRALIGTGLQTAMRPVATILGSLGEADDLVRRGAFAHMGGMLEARNEAWRKAVADFQSYTMGGEGWRGFTTSQADLEWEGMMSYFDEYGTLGEKASAHFANQLRNINKLPLLNYGPRVMKSMDIFFSQIIARGRQRQLAFNDVYKRVRDQGITVSDGEFEDLVKATEIEFESKVFDADGQITDEMAIFAADEAKLTQELEGMAKDLDLVFERAPFFRPWFLFARTGVNALKMTSKYTPLLNRTIREHVDIMTKAWDDPDMIKYGIKSQDDLNIAKATKKGREAIGYTVVSGAIFAAGNGLITGNGPPDRRLRDTWIQNGWAPRSIKVGNAYVSYEALEPFNMFLSFTADVVDAQKVMGEEWAANEFGKLALLISANVSNKPFLAGLGQLQDLFTSGGGSAANTAANFVNNQFPLSGLRNEVGKLFSPGMRELESGFMESIANRNLWIDLISSKNELLPFKYDVLNGERIRTENPIQRLVEGIIPIQINTRTTPTRELLFRSGLSLKQTFNTGPQGQELEGHPDLKSRFQFYMGQLNIEAQLEKVFQDPGIIQSIENMEKDRRDNRSYNVNTGTVHGPVIRKIFRDNKKIAWELLMKDQVFGGKAQRLDELHRLGQMGQDLRSTGQYDRERDLYKHIEQLEAMPIK